MVRLRAPQGASSFSHAGVTYEIDADGMIDVQEHVVPTASSHGFQSLDQAISDDESVTLRRGDLMAALEVLGVAVNPAMRSDKLTEALVATVKARAKPVPSPKAKAIADKTAA
jgi:hypothetical protein